MNLGLLQFSVLAVAGLLLLLSAAHAQTGLLAVAIERRWNSKSLFITAAQAANVPLTISTLSAWDEKNTTDFVLIIAGVMAVNFVASHCEM